MTDSYTPEERQNLVGDIARWKVELEEVGGGNQYPDEELTEYVENLYSMTDEALQSHWNSTVGEWVVSRHDMPIPEETDVEDWLNEQFEMLLQGEGVPWGYVTWVEVPPESEVGS